MKDWCKTAIMLSLFVPMHEGLPASASPELSDSARGVRLSASAERPCEACGFVITINSGTSRRVFEVRSSIKSLSSVRIIGPTLGALIGKYDDYAAWVTAFNLSDGQTTMNAPAYRPSISPDGRYLVYVRFYPEHFVEAAVSSNVVEVVDLQQPSATLKIRANTLRGAAVYPDPPDALYHSIQGDFEWHGSSDLSFEDLIGGYTYAVNLSLRKEAARVTRMKTSKVHADY